VVSVRARRVFLGWERPALHAVVDAVVAQDRAAAGAEPAAVARPGDGAGLGAPLDLRRLWIVLPTARAGRRLLELLVERAAADRRPLFRPTILEPGALAAALTPADPGVAPPAADDLCRRLAWASALRQAPAAVRAVVTSGGAPARAVDELGHARAIDALYGEIASAGLDFAEVAARGAILDAFPDAGRWEALARLEAAYHATLAREGLADARAAAARAARGALASSDPGAPGRAPDGPLPPDAELVLACVPDLPPVIAALVRRHAGRVTSLVLAPEALADRFDDLGGVVVDAWRGAAIDVPDGAVRVAEDPTGQAAEVVRWLAALPQPVAPEDVVVGVPDRDVVPSLLLRIDDAVHGADVAIEDRAPAARDAEGTPMPRTPLFTLLAAVAAYLEARDTRSLGALVRHPEVERRLGGYAARAQDAGDVLGELDVFAGEHVQRRVPRSGERWPAREPRPREGAAPPAASQPAPSAGAPYPALRRAVALLDDLLAPLAAGAPASRPLPRWAEPIAAVTRALLDDPDEAAPGTAPLPAARAVRRQGALETSEPYERLLARGVQALGDVLQALAQVPEPLAPAVEAVDALRLVLDALADARVPHEEQAQAIELLGWLELPLEDAPHLIVTGFVEGRLPGSTPASPYLPDRLRAALALDDDARRHARDAYALTCLLALRRDLVLVTARRDSQGAPLSPSRLLLATDAERAARRVLAFYADDVAPRPPLVRALTPGVPAGASFPRLPPTPPEAPLTSLPVTAFRDYLACPFRFYLAHVARLRRPTDDAVELDPALFGSLAHEALRVLGSDALAACADARRIAEALQDALADRARAWLGDGAYPAVRLQIEQLRARLVAFAQVQARIAGSGRRIVHVEASVRDAALAVDAIPFGLTGRIDRVDVDERTGVVYLLDYKTGDNAVTPDEAHRSKGRWVDLQLPLYRHLAARLDLDARAPLAVGYLALPRAARDCREHIAAWTETDLSAADEAARDVVRRLRGPVEARYWPPAETPPPFTEDFAEICQDGRLGAAPAPEPEGDGEGDGNSDDGART
jgi:RecB family exonuclease